MRVLHLVAILVGLVLVPAVRAADTWPVPRGPSNEPRPYKFDATKPPTVPREYLEDTSACILYAASTYRLEADGTLVTTNHEITRLNGRKGIEKLGEHRNVTWNPGYEQATLHEGRIHKPDGKIIHAEPRDAQIRDVGTDYQVYDTDKHLVITFPTLDVGDAIEVKWTVRGKNAEHAGHLFRRYSFGDPEHPIVRDELRVVLPANRTLGFASVNREMKPEITEQDGQKIWFWAADNCPPVSRDDGLPSREELRPTVAVSTFTTWDEVGRWKQTLRKKCWECTADIKAIVAETTRGLNDPVAKAKALTYWLRRNIRYVSIGSGHDYTPHLPGQVLATRYGDCKDTSQFLAVMLREAGLRVELATLGVLDDGQVLPELPSPWGTHAILCVTIDGKSHWIDTTASLYGWDTLPRGDRDRMTYLVDDAGKIRLLRTPALRPEENRFEQTTKLYIGNDGTTRFERTTVAYGIAGRSLRDDLLEVPVGERRRQVTSEIQDAFSNARLLELSVDEKELRDLDAPVRLKVAFVVEDHFRAATNNERDGNVSDSKIWGRLLSWTLDYDRKQPFQLYAPFQTTHRFEVHLPAAYTLENRPRSKAITSPWANFTLQVEPRADQGPDLVFTMTTRADKIRVLPVDFEKFREFQAEVTRSYRVYMTMKPVQDLSEAGLLEAQLHWLPEDGDAAAVLARLYADNGRIREAERIVRRSLAYATKNKNLWETAVSIFTDPDEEEKAQRKLVELFPTEAKYQLNLAASLITKGRHKDARELLAPILKEGSARDQADAHYQLARGHYRVDELKQAETELQTAEKIDPVATERLRFRILQGQVAEELGKLDEARRFYDLALKLNSEATFAREGLVRLAVARKDDSEALKHLRRLVVEAGNDAMNLLAAAEYSFRLERFADASELVARAEKETSTPKGRRLLGLLALQRGEADKALTHLLKAGSDPVTLEATIRAHLMLGELDKTEPLADRGERSGSEELALRVAIKRVRKLQTRRDELLKLAPENRAAVGVVACIEEAVLEIGAGERGRTLTARALELAPKLGLALAWQGKLALEQGKLTRARTEAEAAIRAVPNYWLGYYVRGVIALERDQDSLADLRKAVALNPTGDAGTFLALGKALLRAKMPAEARAALLEAQRLRPDLTEVKETLRDLNGE